MLEAARHVLATPGLPPVVEILATAHHSEQHPQRVDNVKVDLIPTSPIVDGDLDGFEDDDLLFLAGHRWSFEGPNQPDSVPPGRILSISMLRQLRDSSRRRATLSATHALDGGQRSTVRICSTCSASSTFTTAA